MASDQTKKSGLSLDSYSLESGPPAEGDTAPVMQARREAATPASDQPAGAAGLSDALPSLPIRITLRGSGFQIRARDPKIMIGDVQLMDYEILSDQTTIVGYLHELPPEGSIISIDYGRAGQAELPERFSLSKFTGDIG